MKLLEELLHLDEGQLDALGFYVARPGCRKTGVGYVRRQGDGVKMVMNDGTLRIPAFEDGVTIKDGRIY